MCQGLVSKLCTGAQKLQACNGPGYNENEILSLVLNDGDADSCSTAPARLHSIFRSNHMYHLHDGSVVAMYDPCKVNDEENHSVGIRTSPHM
jgi:hypothetical protein